MVREKIESYKKMREELAAMRSGSYIHLTICILNCTAAIHTHILQYIQYATYVVSCMYVCMYVCVCVELVVLQRTEQILKNNDRNLEEFLTELEKQKGIEVSGLLVVYVSAAEL